MARSILAVLVGLFVVVGIDVLASIFHTAAASHEVIALLGMVLGGYIVAFISGRARVMHGLILAVVLNGISVFSNLSMPKHSDWPSLIVGALASTIYMTWGALFRKWQISKPLRHEQTQQKNLSLREGAVAIGVGFSIYMVYGLLSGAFWDDNYWGINESFNLFGVVVTNLLAGYLTAYFSKQAQLRNILVMSALCLMTPVVVRMITGYHGDWGRWFLGALTVIIYMTWGGFLRTLQLQYRGPRIPIVLPPAEAI